MSSSTPADSDSPGVAFSDTDTTSIEEHMPEHGTVDPDVKKPSPDNRLSIDDYPEAIPFLLESEGPQSDVGVQGIEKHIEETEPDALSNNSDTNSEEEIQEVATSEEKPANKEETEEQVIAEGESVNASTSEGPIEEQVSAEETVNENISKDAIEEPASQEELVSAEETKEVVGEKETEEAPILAEETSMNGVEASPGVSPLGETEIMPGIGLTPGDTPMPEDENSKKTPVETIPSLRKQTPTPMDQLDMLPTRRFTRYWVLSVALLLLLMAAILTPLIMVTSYGVNAYATYNLLRAHAYGGVQHLLTVKTIFTGASSHPTSVLNASKLIHANQEIVAAHDDFVQIQLLIKNTSLIHTVTQYLPQYRPQVASALAASQIGIDATLIGEEIMSTALKLAPNFQGPLLSSNSHAPLVTENDLALIGSTINAIIPHLNSIQAQSRTLSLAALPISSTQRTQLEAALLLLPQVQTLLKSGSELLGPANWLLGVGQPRVFLVQTMDRAELRATGGFTGQYGELSINSGRVGPFSLHDISGVEYTDNSPTIGQSAPAAYSSWWPFANWGLRDSNLSADFPTSARIAIAEYKHEVNRKVDGVVSFTPFFIEHILQAVGPLKIPKYNETITAENLEQKLHYYQLDNAGIRKIEIVDHVTANDPNIRKLFTSAVASVLMDHLRHATPDELLSLGLQVLHDLKTKDLQVYMTNPQIENLLMHYNDASIIDRSNMHDGLMIVQTNVSASKASQYVQTNLHDSVTLDAQGGATHTLQIHLIYNQIGPVYGLDTYRDYVRVYVPKSAKLLSGNGFDTGVALCGGNLAACPADGVYPHQELVCPTGQYNAGAAAQMLNDPYQGAWHPIDQIGPPDNTKSDVQGKAMFGGYVVVPKNCSMTVSLSWHVPALDKSNSNYNLLVQRQASTFPLLDLTVTPLVGACASSSSTGLHYNGIVTEDTAFTLKGVSQARSGSTACSLVQSTNPTLIP